MVVGGCVDTAGQARVDPSAAAPSKVARRDGVSPRGATVALAGIDGAPQDVAVRFSSAFREAAAAQDIATTEPKKADYLVRGYLTAYSDDGGTTRLSYVLDMFDKGRRRVQRLTDDMPIKGASSDPWSIISEPAMQTLAQRSAGDLADALTNTPEAVAGAAIASARPASGATVAASAGSTTVAREESAPAARKLGLAQTR
jgi:hypothetical protein